MIPKVGDIVRLNPDFLKAYFRRVNRNIYFGEEVWEENFIVTEIDFLKSVSLIKIKINHKDNTYECMHYLMVNQIYHIMSKNLKVFKFLSLPFNNKLF